MTDKVMFSYSDIADYMRCPWKFQAKKLRNLERVGFNLKMERGTWFHAVMMEDALGTDWRAAHEKLVEEFEATVVPYTDDEAILGMPDDVVRLVEAYKKHYTDDPWKTVLAEESLAFQLPNGIWVGFTPDWVIEDSLAGIWGVDRKTLGTMPQIGANVVDLQHTTYTLGLRRIYGEDFKGFVFDNVRTKPPTVPRLKKDGGIAYLDRLDTDYTTLIEFVHDNDIEHTPDLTAKLARLSGDKNKFFRRDYFILPQEGIEQTERELVYWTDRMQADIESGVFGRAPMGAWAGAASCANCPMQLICQTELLGFSTEGAMLEYKERTPLNREYKEV